MILNTIKQRPSHNLTSTKPLIGDYVINVSTGEIGILADVDFVTGMLIVRLHRVSVAWNPYTVNLFMEAPAGFRKDW